MSLIEDIRNEQKLKQTENGAAALCSTGSALTDLFAISGALRSRREDEIRMMFAKALSEDRLLATKLAFYTRDVRGGLGERKTGRIMFDHLRKHYPEILDKNMELIPEYGRWDDLVSLIDGSSKAMAIIEKQLKKDIAGMEENKSVSLLAKWLPSINATSKETIAKGRKLAAGLGMSEKEYRQTLSKLRRYLNIVEVNLSKKEYDHILYPEVPSKAMNRYRAAFKRNDKERFEAFLNEVRNGKEKVCSSVLYPYDIVEKYLYHAGKEDALLEEQWKAMPDFIGGENRSLVMADVSGSMYGRPLATSIGLALYFAQRNKGTFANTFMTFSARPELVDIKGRTLFEKINYIQNADWQMNTDLEAAFDLVLRTAVKNKTAKEEMPDSIIIITDMEIDRCCGKDQLFYDQTKQRFEENGYEIPNIVFWNVSARQNTYHASAFGKGVQLASGQSPIVFRSLIQGKDLSPYDYMVSVLNVPRYEAISV